MQFCEVSLDVFVAFALVFGVKFNSSELYINVSKGAFRKSISIIDKLKKIRLELSVITEVVDRGTSSSFGENLTSKRRFNPK